MQRKGIFSCKLNASCWELKKQIEALHKFPDHNPNPVLRMSFDGKLQYSNNGSQYLRNVWGIKPGDDLPSELVKQTRIGTRSPLEMRVGDRVFSFHVTAVPDLGFINIYGTDVTSEKAITKFPDHNPNPVLRASADGKLQYSNAGGEYICNEWGISIGQDVPLDFIKHSKPDIPTPFEMEVGDRVFIFHVVAVPGLGFINIYGKDITASRANDLITKKLSKYFSPQVYEAIFTGDLDVKVATRRKMLSVFFSDIKGFTQLTERLEPEILTRLVTNYLTAMTRIAIAHGGTVDKYIGDAIMVFFGDPKSRGHKEDAISCVKMAIDMRKDLRSMRETWKRLGISQPLDIRIGIHTDICTVGNFGSEDRLDYTTIGNGVNLASRLENNAEPGQILVSEDTFLLVNDEIDCRKLDKVQVKNLSHAIQTYEVIGNIGGANKNTEIKEESDGFTVFIDPKNADHLDEKREVLERALDLLDSLG